MAYSSISKPSLHFNTKLYTGNGGTQSITGVGFQPDWLWIKSRSSTESHFVFDSVRGQSKYIFPNANNAEGTAGTGILNSFNSDGFTLGNNDGVNANSQTFVAWNWKAGTSFTNDASSTGVGSIDSTASVSQTAGVSIVKYIGTGSNETVAHGLGLAPEIMICKNLSATENWVVYVKSLGNTKRLVLDTTGAVGTDATIFNSTTPNTTVFGIGENAGANGNGHGQIAYCFSSVKGYSKIGSYVGNGNANGPFIYTGFAPAFFMLKRTDGTNSWRMWDNKRDPFNVRDSSINANESDAEYTDASVYMDFVSNGVKFRTTGDNVSGGNYIYMVFAENPFVAGNFNPATAR